METFTYSSLKSNADILFIVPSGHIGGAETVMVKLFKYLPRQYISPYLSFVSHTGPLLNTIPKDIPTYSFGGKRLSLSLFAIIRLIRTLKPDTVFTSLYGLNIVILLLKPFLPRKTKLVIRESNLPSIALSNEKFSTIIGFFIRYFYPKADKIVCLCNEMKKDLIDSFNIPEQKIIVIPNPVDTDNIKFMADKTQNPFDDNLFNFLSVGSLRPQKGFDLLIEAFEIVASQCPNIHLTIVGDGKLKQYLVDLINEKKLSDLITLAGYQPNPFPYFINADRFVLSSRSEGLPNAALESLALGTPVIALDNPGCIHDFIKSAPAGKIVHPPSFEELAKEMLRAVNMGKSNTTIDLLPEYFKVENVIEDYQELFLSC